VSIPKHCAATHTPFPQTPNLAVFGMQTLLREHDGLRRFQGHSAPDGLVILGGVMISSVEVHDGTTNRRLSGRLRKGP
jgi:hypothetical protein